VEAFCLSLGGEQALEQRIWFERGAEKAFKGCILSSWLFELKETDWSWMGV